MPAQQPTTGLNIAPVYQGWEPNEDGSFNLLFGYFNRNWEEWVNVPVGAANSMDPGGPDHGQPTHFLPRRNQFVFKVRVPKDFGTREIVWTLTSNGKTEKAYGTLKPDYIVDDRVYAANFGGAGQLATSPDLVGNKTPVLEVQGARTRTVKVGEPVSLTAVATDDGKPKVKPMMSFAGGIRTLPNSATGLQARVDQVSRRGRRDLRPEAVQRLGGHPRRRELAVGRRLEDAARSAREHVGGSRDVQGARRVRPAVHCPRRRPDRRRERHGRRHALICHEDAKTRCQEDAKTLVIELRRVTCRSAGRSANSRQCLPRERRRAVAVSHGHAWDVSSRARRSHPAPGDRAPPHVHDGPRSGAMMPNCNAPIRDDPSLAIRLLLVTKHLDR